MGSCLGSDHVVHHSTFDSIFRGDVALDTFVNGISVEAEISNNKRVFEDLQPGKRHHQHSGPLLNGFCYKTSNAVNALIILQVKNIMI